MALREGADAQVLSEALVMARDKYPCESDVDCLEALIFNGTVVCPNCFRRMLYDDPGGFTERQLDTVGRVYEAMIERMRGARDTPVTQQDDEGVTQEKLDL